jgi:FkbM family methyltransferase
MLKYPGNMHLGNREDHIAKVIRNKGGYELDLLRATQAYLWDLDTDEPGLIFDVGAHIGNFSCFVQSLDFGHKVVALEPNPYTFDVLSENADTFDFMAINAAVTDEFPACNVIPGPDGNSGMSRVEEGTQIPCFALDDLADDEEDVLIIKIDVEGSELAVLRTATQILHQWAPMVICEAQTAEAKAAIDEFLEPFGYRCTGHRYCATPTYIWI